MQTAALVRVAGLSMLLIVFVGWGGGEQQTDPGQERLMRGTALARKGDMKRAIARFDAAIQLESDSAAAYNNRGYAYFSEGDSARAIADFTQAMRLNPKDRAAYANRCWAYNAVGLYDQAIADCSKVLELNPEDAGAYSSRGYSYSRKQAYDQAIADLTTAIRLDPQYAIPYRHRGIAYSRMGRYALAIQDLQSSHKLDPENALVYNDLAWLWSTSPEAHLRDGKKALEYATRACDMTAWKDATSLETLAAAYAENGRYDEALRWMERAIAHANEEQKGLFRSRAELYRTGKPVRMAPHSQGS